MTKLWKHMRVQQLGKACYQPWSVQHYHSRNPNEHKEALQMAQLYCITCVQDGNASTSAPISVICFEYFMLRICKEKSESI